MAVAVVKEPKSCLVASAFGWELKVALGTNNASILELTP